MGKRDKTAPKNKTKKSRGLLLMLCDRIAESFGRGAVAGWLSNYRRDEESYGKTATGTCLATPSMRMTRTKRMRLRLSAEIESSYVLGLVRELFTKLFYCEVGMYATLLLVFGAYTVFTALLKALLFDASVPMTDYITATAVAGSAVFALSSRKPLAEALKDSVLTHLFLIDICEIPEEKFKDRPKSNRGRSVAGIVGLVLGLMTWFVSPLKLLGALALCALSWLIFCCPEAGIIVSVFSAPFLCFAERPSMTLGIMMLYTAAVYLIKYLRGKRVIKLRLADIPVAFFAIILLCGGIGSTDGGSWLYAGLMFLLLGIYFLTANLGVTEKYLNAAAMALQASATVVSIWGLYEYFLGIAKPEWLDMTLYSGISGRIAVAFENPNILSVYLIMAFPLCLRTLFSAKSGRGRFLALLSTISVLLCTLFTWSRGAWLGMAVGSVIYLTYIWKYTPALLPIPLLGAITAACLLPDSFGARIFNFFSLTDSTNYYRMGVWRAASRLLGRVWISGTGVGEQAFSLAYAAYASPGMETAPHAHSLYLEIFVETGIFGIAAFLISMMLIMRRGFGFAGSGRGGRLGTLSVAALSGVISCLISGIFDYSWYSYRVFFIFWFLLGLASAAVNVGDAEGREEDRTDTAEAAELVIDGAE